jgi:hypothetical protein
MDHDLTGIFKWSGVKREPYECIICTTVLVECSGGQHMADLVYMWTRFGGAICSDRHWTSWVNQSEASGRL